MRTVVLILACSLFVLAACTNDYAALRFYAEPTVTAGAAGAAGSAGAAGASTGGTAGAAAAAGGN